MRNNSCSSSVRGISYLCEYGDSGLLVDDVTDRCCCCCECGKECDDDDDEECPLSPWDGNGEYADEECGHVDDGRG